jgi:hypothetical protein
MTKATNDTSIKGLREKVRQQEQTIQDLEDARFNQHLKHEAELERARHEAAVKKGNQLQAVFEGKLTRLQDAYYHLRDINTVLAICSFILTIGFVALVFIVT